MYAKKIPIRMLYGWKAEGILEERRFLRFHETTLISFRLTPVVPEISFPI